MYLYLRVERCQTPQARSLSISPPLSAVHRCANVCARSVARKDKEERRLSVVCSPVTVVCSKFCRDFHPSLKSFLCEPLGSRRLHKFAPRNAASGAHRWVRTARCQRSQSAPSKLTIRLHNWTPNLPSWVREQSVGFSCEPAVVPCLIQGEMDLYAR